MTWIDEEALPKVKNGYEKNFGPTEKQKGSGRERVILSPFDSIVSEKHPVFQEDTAGGVCKLAPILSNA